VDGDRDQSRARGLQRRHDEVIRGERVGRAGPWWGSKKLLAPFAQRRDNPPRCDDGNDVSVSSIRRKTPLCRFDQSENR